MGSKRSFERKNRLYKGQGRPISRILLYPAIHLRGIPGLPSGSRAYQPDAVRPNNLACSHRWFTWPAPRGIPPVGSYPTLSPITCGRKLPDPSAGLLSVALDVTGGFPAPRVDWPERPLLRVRTLLYARGQRPRNAAAGRTARTRPIIPYEPNDELLAPPRRSSTNLVGVRRSSTLSVPLQRLCQRGSFPTSGSNQTPGPDGSSTPS